MLDPISWFAACVIAGIIMIVDQALTNRGEVEGEELPVKIKPVDIELARKMKIKELENRLILDTELSTEQYAQIVETIKFLKDSKV